MSSDGSTGLDVAHEQAIINDDDRRYCCFSPSVSLMVDARQLFRWMVVARTLGTTLWTVNVRWVPVEGEEAVHVGSFVDLRPHDAAAPPYRDPFFPYLMGCAEPWRPLGQGLCKAAR